ncbi:NifB/NifX family molybdenum-iron cluster-binding protein [Oceanithermus sp.]
MRVAIAITPNATEIFSGYFGRAPFFAVYEKQDSGWQRIELRSNPYQALEGGGKGRLLERLLADCEVWLGAKFGPERQGEHELLSDDVPRNHLRLVTKASSPKEALASLRLP